MKLRWPSSLMRRMPHVPNGIRALAAGLLAVGGALFLASWLDRSLKLRNWFFFDLATIWLWQVYLNAALVSTGALLVHKLLPDRDRTRLETFAYAYPVGVVVFVLGLYVGGFLHLLGPVFAVVLPALMIAAGARHARAAWEAARAAGTLPRLSLSGLPLVFSVIGVLMLGVLYLGAMSPDAINYDASWMHLVIAQDYAREGHIVAFPGDWILNVAHLGSVVNTWAFLVPGLNLPALRWMMALHTEFVAVVWTMVGIAAATRWLAERDVAGTWVAYLLFPGLFVYDHNIGGAADHYLAMFTAPLLLAAGRALRKFDRGSCLLLGVIGGGALMTKMQATYLLVPIAGLGALRGLYLMWRRRRGDGDAPTPRAILTGCGLAGAALLLVMAPHWGFDAIVFHNPFYPLATDIFPGGVVRDAPMHMSKVMPEWQYVAPAYLPERLKRAVELSFTFSFIPHYSFVGELPMFGSVFTLALPLLLVLPRARRLWLGAFIGMAAVFMWGFTYWVDRNLQTFLPVLIVVTAAIIVRAWELGWFARIGVAALVVVQIAWGTGLYFQGTDRINGALHLLKSGMEGRARDVLKGYRSQYVALGESLPANARILLHYQHVSLGFNRPVTLDWVPFQDQIDYRRFRTPRELYDRLRALGITHLVWVPGTRPAPSRAEEILWAVFADSLHQRQQFGEFAVAPMPATPPPVEAPYQVLVLAVPGLSDGIYPIQALSSNDQLPPALQFHARPSKTAYTPAALIDEAKVVLIGTPSGMDPAVSERLNRDFRPIQAAGGVRVLLRR
jgi:hypothetical protein